jgi:hypothetical protein
MNRNLQTDSTPKQTCFDLPEGTYRAMLIRLTCPRPSAIRFVFEIQAALSAEFIFNPGIRYLAGRSFDRSLVEGSELREFLQSWKGHDITLQERLGGRLDLDQLIGQEADLSLTHIKNAGYATASVLISQICPPEQLMPLVSKQACRISQEFLRQLSKIALN